MASENRDDQSLLAGLEARVHEQAEEASSQLDERDPAYIESVMPAVEFAMKWFDPEVRGMEQLPAEGPFLIVGNHSGGVFMPDYYAFLREWVRRRGAEAPLYSLGLDVIFSIPGAARNARRMGTVPARHDTADELLGRGAAVLVYPGGDEDDYRPWTERHRIDLHGHMGFVRLALRRQVPVAPLVTHGSHDAIVVLARGNGLAKALHLDRFRIHVLPVVLGPLGPLLLPVAGPPLPAKVISKVCEPFDWSHHGPDAADDEEIVRHCYEEMLGRMQANLDELVAEVPHPVRTRVGRALRLDRLLGRQRRGADE